MRGRRPPDRKREIEPDPVVVIAVALIHVTPAICDSGSDLVALLIRPNEIESLLSVPANVVRSVRSAMPKLRPKLGLASDFLKATSRRRNPNAKNGGQDDNQSRARAPRIRPGDSSEGSAYKETVWMIAGLDSFRGISLIMQWPNFTKRATFRIQTATSRSFITHLIAQVVNTSLKPSSLFLKPPCVFEHDGQPIRVARSVFAWHYDNALNV